MAKWNSEQYLKFEKERTQPSIDLVARIETVAPKKIIDIGCGPGNSTQALKKRYPEAQVIGVDNSEEMLIQARLDYPEIEFLLVDVNQDIAFLGNDYDIVFSNACIQWVPDHPKLLTKLMKLLRSGGTLAVQTPLANLSKIHQIIEATTTNQKWQNDFTVSRLFYNLTPGQYHDLFSEIAADFTLWETHYYHRLDSPQATIEWYRGTGLRPYLAQLSEEKQQDFEKDLLEQVIESYPRQKNGEVLFKFSRLFFTAIAK